MGQAVGISGAKAPGQGAKLARYPDPFTLLRGAWGRVRDVAGRLLLLIIVAQLLISVVGLPLASWVFREALRANGMYALDTNTFQFHWGFTLTVLLLFLALLLIMWMLVLEFSAIILLLQHPDRSWRELGKVALKVSLRAWKPSSWMLILYLLVLLPLSGFGFTSALIRWVRIPNFITGELEKEALFRFLLVALGALLLYVNLRLSVTVPIFVLSKNTGNHSLKESWRITRGLSSWTILVSGLVVAAAALLLSTALFYLMLLPTLVSDAVAPGASFVVAALSLGFAHVLTLVLTAAVVALFAGVLTEYGESRGALVVTPGPQSAEGQAGNKGRISGRVAVGIVIASSLVMGVLSVPSLRSLSEHPETLVLAHRGWTEKGVENSIEALEAAAALGPDFVEFDTMRTADGQYVVIHDATLGRLAGKNVAVKDLTLDELTAMTIHDEHGHTAKIPSLVDYVTRANELGQPLLIEIKLSGAEGDATDNVADVIEVLQANDLLEGHIFHTLDHATAEALKTGLPDSTVGYIMPFAALGVPETLANFLVLEESSATSSMREYVDDAGLGYFVWTVDDPEQIRLRLREGVDAIITDHPDKALKEREAIQEESGLAGRLHDLMLSFITVV